MANRRFPQFLQLFIMLIICISWSQNTYRTLLGPIHDINNSSHIRSYLQFDLPVSYSNFFTTDMWNNHELCLYFMMSYDNCQICRISKQSLFNGIGDVNAVTTYSILPSELNSPNPPLSGRILQRNFTFSNFAWHISLFQRFSKTKDFFKLNIALGFWLIFTLNSFNFQHSYVLAHSRRETFSCRPVAGSVAVTGTQPS